MVLAGVRPEETREWPLEPATALSFGASADAQAQAVEQTIEQGRRVAARGGHAVVLVDTLEALPAAAARRALAAARNISDGGSLTVIATATAPLGGETTVVALDAGLTALGRFPALDLEGSGDAAPRPARRGRGRRGDRQGASRSARRRPLAGDGGAGERQLRLGGGGDGFDYRGLLVPIAGPSRPTTFRTSVSATEHARIVTELRAFLMRSS